MSRLLQRGRLEVETDILLGVDEVMLAAGMAVAPVEQSVVASPLSTPVPASAARPAPVARGFDAALFAGTPNAAGASADTAWRGAAEPARTPRAELRTEPRTQQDAQQRADVRPVRTAADMDRTPVGAASPMLAPTPLVDRIAAPMGASKSARLAALDALHAQACAHCTTATAHTRLVFGEGNPDAAIVFVGEAPGETEDRLGRPFVGRAGEKLDEMIAAMGLRRQEVYIANVLKSRPPDNRTPLAHEVDACGPYLLAQLAVIRPQVIVTLGGPASKLLLASELGITRLRGMLARVSLGLAEGQPFEVPVMPTFHPAYLLRNYTMETRQQVWEDLKKVMGVLGRPIPTRATTGPEPSHQS
jgi:DNA polymerase